MWLQHFLFWLIATSFEFKVTNAVEVFDSFESPCAEYKLVNTKKNYVKARAFCKNDGGFLAEIKSQTEQDFLAKILSEKDVRFDYLVGVKSGSNKKTWIYTDDVTPVCYTNWTQEEFLAQRHKTDECVILSEKSEFKWDIAPCYKKRRFICQYKRTNADEECDIPSYVICDDMNKCIPASAKCDDINDCSDGSDEKDCNDVVMHPPRPRTNAVYGPYETKCHKIQVFTRHRRWSKAQMTCINSGGKLLQINSEQMQNTITGILQAYSDLGHYSYWIGVYDKWNEGTWMYNRVRPACYTHFMNNRPVGKRPALEDCVIMRNDANFSWDDIPCNSKKPFICQYDLQTAPAECKERSHFVCDGDRCLPIEQYCDGSVQCDDESDEADCPTSDTSTTERDIVSYFYCDVDTCLPLEQYCDGVVQCEDGTDEVNCTTTEQVTTAVECNELFQFACDVNTCIPIEQYCDGDVQCNDGSDEEDCPTTQLSTTPMECDFSSHFLCDVDTCLPNEQYCDDIEQCNDGTDEINCPTTQPPTTLPPYLWDKPDQYYCCLERCIDMNAVCDGVMHCHDNHDEIPCQTGVTDCAGSDTYQCHGDHCIASSLTCDGRLDCKYRDDEGPDCGQVTPPVKFVTDEFTRKAVLPTGEAYKLDAFNIDDTTYLAAPNRMDNIVLLYKFENDAFSEHQSIDDVKSVDDVEHFQIDNDHYLAFASNAVGANSTVYKWDGASFQLYQRLSSLSSHHIDIHAFKADIYDTYFISLCTRPPFGDSTVEIFEFQSSQFERTQEISLNGVMQTTSFSTPTNTYLVVAESSSTADEQTKVYQLDQSTREFSLYQTMPVKGSSFAAVPFMSPDGALYLMDMITQNVDDDTQQVQSALYIWRGNQFTLHQMIPTFAATMACPVIIDNEQYILLLSGPSADSVARSVVYKLYDHYLHSYQHISGRVASECVAFQNNANYYIFIPEPAKLGSLYKWMYD